MLSEYGVGGGVHQNGSVPATTAAGAASLPFFGIFGSFDPATGGYRRSTTGWWREVHGVVRMAAHMRARALPAAAAAAACADPWRTNAPESESIEVRDWRRHFYKQTSRWLMTGGGPTYRVDGLYLWALASWDVQAIHYASRSALGSYRDDKITALIKQHNTYVNSASRRRRASRRL